MNGKIVESTLKTALTESSQVAVTLKSDGKDYTTFLQTMHYFGRISLKNPEVMEAAVKQSYNWKKEENRTFSMTLTKRFDMISFVDQMYLGIEKIVVVN